MMFWLFFAVLQQFVTFSDNRWIILLRILVIMYYVGTKLVSRCKIVTIGKNLVNDLSYIEIQMNGELYFLYIHWPDSFVNAQIFENKFRSSISKLHAETIDSLVGASKIIFMNCEHSLWTVCGMFDMPYIQLCGPTLTATV